MITFSSKFDIRDEYKELIMKSLPQDWDTEIKDVFVDKNIEIYLRINAKSVKEIQNWISNYEKITNTSYSIQTTYKCSGQRVLFKRSYHCQHRTRHKDTYDPVYRKSIKNTNCPSTFSVAIRTFKKRYQGKDKNRAPDQNKPCEIRLRLQHNHSTTNSMALKFKKVLPEVRQDLLNLFAQGHTAATALQSLKADIRLNFENFQEVLRDRSKCPDYSYCHYLYQKFLPDKKIEFDSEFLEKKLHEYNIKMNDISAKMHVSESGLVICLCPPLIRRIHQSEINSSAIVFIDSISMCDKHDSRIFILITQSESGGLPLGVVMTSSTSVSEIKLGFNMLKEMLNEVAFFGNVNGPQIILTDEYLVHNEIISSVWPYTKILLSVFHVLQRVWKWLQSAKNCISPCDRSVLFKDFSNMLYAETESKFLAKYEVAKQNAVKYKHYLRYLGGYFESRHLWTFCHRSNLTDSNCYEFIMRVLRDKIFYRLKSFNLVQMIDFIINIFFRYFEQQLLDVAFNRESRNIFYTKAQMPSEEISSQIQVIDKNVRLVPSEKVKDLFYMVNIDLLTCTCFNGNSNTICKHVQWVFNMIHYQEFCKKIKTVDVRRKCYLIATGKDSLDDFQHTINDDNDDNQLYDSFDISPSPENINHELYEEMFVAVAMETNDIIDMDKYLVMKQKDVCDENCRKSLEKMSNKFEKLLDKHPKELLSALRILSSRFDNVKSVSDLCAVFSICDPG